MEQTDSCQRGGGWWDWMKEEKISQKTHVPNTQTQTTVW